MIKAENDLTINVGQKPISQKVEGTIEQGKQQAVELAHQAQQEAKSVVTDRKQQAVEELSSISEAFRNSSQQLREQQKDTVATYTDKAAEQIERFSSYLGDKSVNELLEDVQEFAHRQPEIFLGGAFALGLMAARFMKSSGTRNSSTQPRYPQQGLPIATPSNNPGVVSVYDPYSNNS